MGRRGPRPEPTRLKVLKGNPGKRALNFREPKPELKAPPRPEWLRPEAQVEWDRTVPLLEELGILTVVDGDALAAYCQAFARWRAAEEYLAANGEVYVLRDEQGNVRFQQQVPQVAIARHLMQTVLRYQQEFGLTPSSRTAICGDVKPKRKDTERGALARNLLGA